MKLRLAAALLLLGPLLQAQELRTARILLVTGHDGPWHDWKATAPVVKELLEQDGRIRVDVLEKPHELGTADLSGYRAVVLHFSAGVLKDPAWKDPGEDAQRGLKGFVERGGGLGVLHFACFAFRDWPGYADLAGRVWDRRRGHDPRGPFKVEIADPDHEVTRGLDAFMADDELYTCLSGERPVRTLAHARSVVNGETHPMAFVFDAGKGRVFHSPLGHDVKAFRMPGTSALLRRGVAWAAGLPPLR